MQKGGGKNRQWLHSIPYWFGFFGILLLVFFFAYPALATNIPETGINELGETLKLPGDDIRIIIARIIRVLLGLLGIIALVIVLYGGYTWMTSGGNEEKITDARKILTNGGIGLAIILSAFSITQFILSKLLEATTGGGKPQIVQEGGTPPLGFQGGGALGKIIEMHYPARDAVNIPRNTKIFITFVEPMDWSTMVLDKSGPNNVAVTETGCAGLGNLIVDGENQKSEDLVNTEGIKIFPTIDGEAATVSAVHVAITSDCRTISLIPDEYIGSPNQNMDYTVLLTGKVKKANGDLAFVGIEDSYDWEFQVSTVVDLTPPYVVSATPFPQETKDRNIVAQIHFSEAMDPTGVSGHAPSFTHLQVATSAITETTESLTTVAGTFTVANQYKSVSFLPDEECGVNACGFPIFCLPATSTIKTTARAAVIDQSKGAPAAVAFTGVTDAAGNSLDGGGEFGIGINEKAEGPPGDNFYWYFKTTDQKNISSPLIETSTPEIEAEKIPANAPLILLFNKVMLVTTFPYIQLQYIQPAQATIDYTPWNTKASTGIDATGKPVESTTVLPVKTKVEVLHGPFIADAGFFSSVPSKVQDEYQNCYYPAEGPGCIPEAKAQATTPSTKVLTVDKAYCCNGEASENECEF